MAILQWLKRNEDLVIAGTVPDIVVSVTYIATIYSFWVAALVVIVPFVVINGLVILTVIWPNVVAENCNEPTSDVRPVTSPGKENA